MNTDNPGQFQSTDAQNAKPCIAVWTRNLPEAEASGRTHLLHGVRSVLTASGPLNEFIAPTVFSRYGRIRGLTVFCLTLIKSILRLRPLPLQCALYSDMSVVRQALGLDKGGLVVIDSIRQLLLVEALRRHAPDLPIVVDMDDLMSRRISLLLENDFEVSLGAFKSKMPRFFANLLSSRVLSRALMRYEIFALRIAEGRLCLAADYVVTVSQLEAEMLTGAVHYSFEPEPIKIAESRLYTNGSVAQIS